ncbi:MAG: hypothetical protein WCO09_00835 [bacterium]
MNNLFISVPIVFLAIYWLGAFFIVYHLIKYGITSWPKKIAGTFLAGSIFLSILSFMLFTQINWQKVFNGALLPNNTLQKNLPTNTK